MSAQPLPVELPYAELTIWTVRLGAREQVTVSPSCLYTFADAPPGLPGSHRFALISDSAFMPLQWLQSLDEWEICLPVLPLDVLDLDGYAADVAHAAGFSEHDAAAPRVFLVTHLGATSIAVNLLAPVVLDATSATGRQVILEAGSRESGVGPTPDSRLPTPIRGGAGYPLRRQVVWDPVARKFRLHVDP